MLELRRQVRLHFTRIINTSLRPCTTGATLHV